MRAFNPFGKSTAAVAASLLCSTRWQHRATHPLHLLRKRASSGAITSLNSSDSTPVYISTPLSATTTTNASATVAAARSATGLSVPHGAGCTCCRPFATAAAGPVGGGDTSTNSRDTAKAREAIERRNQQNAVRSKGRGAAAAGAAAAAAAAGAGAAAPGGTGTDAEVEVARFVGGRLVQSLQREQPPRGSGIQPLLDYNKQWAAEIARLNSDYFSDLAQQQSPQYLWVGCSDSRVPANEIVGLYPGDVFVHRNIANIVCNSDLNALAVLQYAIDCLKVEHVIVAGHYKCGGVMAALNDDRVGLADHWILHVSAVKKRHWERMMTDIPVAYHLDALCELNVLSQLESVVETHLVQRVWSRQNAEDTLARKESRQSRNTADSEVEIHGWVYGLEDGVIRPLLSLTRRSAVQTEIANAVEAIFWRYGQRL